MESKGQFSHRKSVEVMDEGINFEVWTQVIVYSPLELRKRPSIFICGCLEVSVGGKNMEMESGIDGNYQVIALISSGWCYFTSFVGEV